MKNKFLCLILCLCLISSAFVFSACKKDTGYKLKSLYNEYVAIASNNACLEFKNDRLEFNYSIFKGTDGNTYVIDALSKEDLPFKNLINFNNIYYNSMEFVNKNIMAISTDAYNSQISKSLRNDIKTKLDNLNIALSKVDLQTREFAQIISASRQDFTNELYLIPFKHLLDSYDELYDVCYDFTLTFAQIYYVIENDNEDIDYYSKGIDFVTEEDIATAIRHLSNRAGLSISFLSYDYYIQNIQNKKMSTLLTTKTESGFNEMGEDYNSYITNVRQISYNTSATDPAAVNKTDFYNCLVELYNVRESLKNNFEIYNKAFHDIDFKTVKGNFNQTSYEKTCLRIIEYYHYLQHQNYKALQAIYALI